ncbi:hypothetical protein [Streptomyces sp. KHY 26]|uniref:hypothetical protein n=1 Tax=Streptomyces sp. KHY 26 TaxID=3097359 RepID=UPI00376EE2ED
MPLLRQQRDLEGGGRAHAVPEQDQAAVEQRERFRADRGGRLVLGHHHDTVRDGDEAGGDRAQPQPDGRGPPGSGALDERRREQAAPSPVRLITVTGAPTQVAGLPRPTVTTAMPRVS